MSEHFPGGHELRLRRLARKRVEPTESEFAWLRLNLDALRAYVLTMRRNCFNAASISRHYGVPFSPRIEFQQEFRELRLIALALFNTRCCNEACFHNSITRLPPGMSISLWVEVDHVRPVVARPERFLDIFNLQVLCIPCNRGKRGKSVDYRQSDHIERLAKFVELSIAEVKSLIRGKRVMKNEVLLPMDAARPGEDAWPDSEKKEP